MYLEKKINLLKSSKEEEEILIYSEILVNEIKEIY